MSLKFADVDFGRDSGAPIRRMQIEWFDQWLKAERHAHDVAAARTHFRHGRKPLA